MKNNFISLFFALFASIILFSQCASDKKKTDIQAQLQIETTVLNKKCPIYLDSLIRLDSCIVLPNNDLVNYYTVMDSVEVNRDGLFKEIEASVKLASKTEPGMANIRSYGISSEYSYRNIKGDVIHHFKITPEDYN